MQTFGSTTGELNLQAHQTRPVLVASGRLGRTNWQGQANKTTNRLPGQKTNLSQQGLRYEGGRPCRILYNLLLARSRRL